MYIVTGASSGIGRATARALIQRDQEVVVVARSADPLRALGALAPNGCTVVTADLASARGIESVRKAVRDRAKIAGIVHAAGSTIAPTRYQALQRGALADDMAVHVSAPIALNSALEAQLAGGRVVYVDSYSASIPRAGWSGYSIVKAAAQMAARAAAAELKGVDVIRIFPGGVRTPLVDAVLGGPDDLPAVRTFKALETQGKIVEAHVIGRYIAAVLLDATSAQLAKRETWTFGNPEDRLKG